MPKVTRRTERLAAIAKRQQKFLQRIEEIMKEMSGDTAQDNDAVAIVTSASGSIVSSQYSGGGEDVILSAAGGVVLSGDVGSSE